MLLLIAFACTHESQLEGVQQPDPVLTLDTPAAASWHDEGTVEANGTWELLDTIDVNDVPAELSEDGTWATTVHLERGLTVLEAFGSTDDGEHTRFDRVGVLAGTWEDPGRPVSDAMDLRLNEDGLDYATDYAATIVTVQTVNDAALAMNPAYEDSYGVWGWSAVEITGVIDEVDFDTPSIDASPSSGLLELEVTIPNLFVDLQAYGEVIGIGFDSDASMEATKAVITGSLTLDVDKHGGLVIELVDPVVELKGFSYDTSLLPWDVEDYLFVDTVRGMVEDMLLEKIEELVPPMLEETLGGLDLSFELDLLGAPLSLSMDFTEASIDPDGVAMSTAFDVSMPLAGSKSYAGFLGSDPVVPDVDTRSPVAAAISDDLVNLMLFEAWRGGVLDLRLSTDDGSLEPIMLLPLKAEQGTITLRPDLPPVAVQVDGGLQIQAGELVVDIETPDGELGEYLQVAAAAFIDLELALEDGVVALDIGTPELSLMVRQSDWGASDETTTRLVEEMLPLDTFLALLGGLELPLPSLEGLTISSADLGRDRSGLHTTVEVELGM